MSERLIKRTVLLVLVCFFLSGLTGLVYEILWTRMIVKVIGGAPFAVSIVLTVFMAGLGLGSYLASRRIDRVKEPLRLVRIYGILELAIGVYGLILPVLLVAFRPLYEVIYNQLFSHFMLYSLLTFVGCFILLVIPAICMGATLPILCRFYVDRLSHLGTHAGRLYGLNTVGAACGALLCGFWLINLLGVWGTLSVAVLTNVIIGLSCILVSRRIRRWPVSEEEPQSLMGEDVGERVELPRYHGAAVGALIIFAVSGFCAMAYEVIWTKLLGLIVGPTTYSFTIVLVAFITGLALGSMIFGWFADRTRKPIWLLIFTQFAAALFALALSQVLGNSQLFFAKLIYHFQGRFALLSLLKAVILFTFMLFPTLCLGATFPLVGKIFTRSISRVGRSIGLAYCINTVGAVLGSFCAGFLLIPLFGKEQGLSLVICIQLLTSLCIGGYILLANRERRLKWIPLTVPAVVGLLLCFQYPSWNRLLLSRGKYHRFDPIISAINKSGWLNALWNGPDIMARTERSELVYYGDGIGGFTTVLKAVDAFGNTYYALMNSGKTDASSKFDMHIQTLLAHFPMLFHRNPKTVMVLGLASGVTAGEVLHYPIERLDILEISEEMVTASRFFKPWNSDVLSNPKTELIVQDGRAHLQLTGRKYDVIISEPSNPWMAGMATLFTREFFALVKDRLNDDGIFCQWIHTYNMDWPTFSLIGRTFLDIFPNSLLVRTSAGDSLMIGIKGESGLELENAKRNLPYAQRSTNITLPRAELLYRMVGSEDLQRLFGPGPINTDDRPRLEFAAPKQMHADDPMLGKNLQYGGWLSDETRKIVREITTDVDAQIDFASLVLSVYKPFPNMVDLSRATPVQEERFFKLMQAYCANNEIDYSLLSDEELKERCCEAQIEAMEKKIDKSPDKARTYFTMGDICQRNGLLDKAVVNYTKALQVKPDFAKAHVNLGVALAKQGKFDEAIAHYSAALRLKPDLAKARSNLQRALRKAGRHGEASEVMRGK